MYDPENNQFPGPILQKSIISSKKLALDTDLVKKYTNVRLKKDLVESEHFIVVSHLMWKYIYNIYGGFEI
jgi:hypothetical protein